MTSNKPLKTCQGFTSPLARKRLKRMARRLRRRAEKRDLESAPTRIRELVRGWAN